MVNTKTKFIILIILAVLFVTFNRGQKAYACQCGQYGDGCCGSNAGCGSGQMCDPTRGECIPGTGSCTPQDAGCTQVGICGAPAGCAIGNRCKTAANGVASCITDTSCPQPAECHVEGECGSFADSCPENSMCNNGECKPAAADECSNACTSIDCPDGQECIYQGGNAECVPARGCTGFKCIAKTGYRCMVGLYIPDRRCPTPMITPGYEGTVINSLATLFAGIFNALFPLAIIFGVLMIIRGGYIIMTSEGSPQKLTEGKEDLKAAIFGTAFVALAASILRIIITQILGGSI